MIRRVLAEPDFHERPPVLIDIGASGGIHRAWRAIAPHSICIAFDPDARKFPQDKASLYAQLYLFDKVVLPTEETSADLYLTTTPYCSSVLHPANQQLDHWSIADRFTVIKQSRAPAISISKALSDLGLEYIDWFKTDSQGMDLRLFSSIPDQIRTHILQAEFEPGIIDAYQSEDKLWRILEFMSSEQYWLCSVKFGKVAWLSREDRARMGPSAVAGAGQWLATAPGWGELVYLHTLANYIERRSILLGWIFAMLRRQYGFASYISQQGVAAFPGDRLIKQIQTYTKRRLQLAYLTHYPFVVLGNLARALRT